ncbi:protein-glutamate methylesterase/protein-glutamine glutaminase [Pelagibaculum spongiae]|uniref:Protein-glutamate methylesterase/protein-glutamine glutaminase n=1 Tax=Pelagibaculum spongiae TaxID=2080658 RepID=A0A2V1GZ99_9GAMM|nr:chemotaxis response regulator protein-glutamate methylesterase [Pelagibaculum spongiae]PVZ66690.1 chemotaxis response regulator protein-glutamate methylesterase [Pelagibaculum spongiae]
MAVRVLAVDDSSFFRKRIVEILKSDKAIEVVGAAENGRQAVEMARKLKPDVITMDIEMPEMDGISAVRAICSERPVPVLMLSSLTHEGATATLTAMEAGAADFMPKRFEDLASRTGNGGKGLVARVLALARGGRYRLTRPAAAPVPDRSSARPLTTGAASGSTSASAFARTTSKPQTSFASPSQVTAASQPARSHPSVASHASAVSAHLGRVKNTIGRGNDAPKILLIGASTGGPVALQAVLTSLPANFPLPILLVQHMPAAFTKAFAERLDGICNISVKEAQGGETLRPGQALLAPGGMQMLLDGSERSARIRVIESDPSFTYKPSVDLTFGSVSRAFGGLVHAIVLTGMGADGREGCRALKQKGASVWAQDEASCVVYGMPQAVAAAGLADQQFSIEKIAPRLIEELC